MTIHSVTAHARLSRRGRTEDRSGRGRLVEAVLRCWKGEGEDQWWPVPTTAAVSIWMQPLQGCPCHEVDDHRAWRCSQWSDQLQSSVLIFTVEESKAQAGLKAEATAGKRPVTDNTPAPYHIVSYLRLVRLAPLPNATANSAKVSMMLAPYELTKYHSSFMKLRISTTTITTTITTTTTINLSPYPSVRPLVSPRRRWSSCSCWDDGEHQS